MKQTFAALGKKSVKAERISTIADGLRHCFWTVEQLPHIVVLAPDGAILVVRADTLDLLACSYALETSQDVTEIVCETSGNRLVIMQEMDEGFRITELELPSLTFKSQRETPFSMVVDFGAAQHVMVF